MPLLFIWILRICWRKRGFRSGCMTGIWVWSLAGTYRLIGFQKEKFGIGETLDDRYIGIEQIEIKFLG